MDRGDPAAADFAIGDFTKDNAWHTLDLSGIVGTGLKLVLLRFLLRATAAGAYIWLRKNGMSNTKNVAICYIPIANQFDAPSELINTDLGGCIEYKISDTLDTTLDLTVGGWFV